MNPLKIATALLLISATVDAAQSLPAKDQRATVTKDVNSPWIFPEIRSASEWRQRAQDIRENAQVSCGLWPLPPRGPLNARVSPPTLHDGVRVHRVFFETWPGFYLAGNLYTPAVVKPGMKLPAILNPHGHGKFGRLHDDELFSNPARCIQFARMGMVAFSYDMIGYQDTMQLGAHRKFFLQPELQLWNISLGGAQTWDSVRALDFLGSLPFVDRERIACTGESGGGTQTFMLGAVDSRLAVQAPICMVSHSMQGGCQCENAPGLRVDYSSMEIAAAPAPRRQLLVAATGDWTKSTMTIEGPGVATAYRFTKAKENLHYEIHDFPHNYNQTSRESVYAWLNVWLLGSKSTDKVAELPHTPLKDEVARVFPDGKFPPGAVNEEQFIRARTREAEAQFAGLLPKDKRGLEEFKRVQSVAWRHNLHVETPREVLMEKFTPVPTPTGGATVMKLSFGRAGKADRLPGLLLAPKSKRTSAVVVLVSPAGKAEFVGARGEPAGLAAEILKRGMRVLVFDAFGTGELGGGAPRSQFEKFFTSYNRTDVQERVQDLVSATVFVREKLGAKRVLLCGTGRAGLWTLLAASAADAVAADADALDASDDKALLAQDIFTPGLRKMGGFAGIAAAAAPNPLLVHHLGANFSTAALEKTYAVTKNPANLQLEKSALKESAVADWLARAAK
ncbi:MAG: acetylxylan esterase [Verrucomicrobia bacterium]|nr:acetylxylan esterase [Verrucomicrobiota bacterium]